MPNKPRFFTSGHRVPFPSLSQLRTTSAPFPSELQANPKSVSSTRCSVPTISDPRPLSTCRATPQERQPNATAPTSTSALKKRPHEATYPADENEFTRGNPRARHRTTSTSSVETIRITTKEVVEQVLPTPKPRDAPKPNANHPVATRGIATLKKLRNRLTVTPSRIHTHGFDPGRGVPTKEVTAMPPVRDVTRSGSSQTDVVQWLHDQAKENRPTGVRVGVLDTAGSGPVEAGSGQNCSRGRSQLSMDASGGRSPSKPNLNVPFPSKVEEKSTDIRVQSVSNREKPEVRVSFLSLDYTSPTAFPATESVPPELLSTSANGPTTPVIKKDRRGRIQLSAADLDLSITFHDREPPHFEIWDLDDDIYVAWPAQLHLTTKRSYLGMNELTPIATPSVNHIEIQCYTKPLPTTRYSVCEAESGFSVTYRGAKTRDKKGYDLPLLHENGICVQPGWVRTWPTEMTDSEGKRVEITEGEGKRGWFMKAWIPIPTRLFVKRETRTFVVEAGVRIRDKSSGDDEVEEEADMVKGKAEMSVSHLRRCREMNRGGYW